MVKDPCTCRKLHRLLAKNNWADGEPRCWHCTDQIVAEKNDVVRDNYCLRQAYKQLQDQVNLLSEIVRHYQQQNPVAES